MIPLSLLSLIIVLLLAGMFFLAHWVERHDSKKAKFLRNPNLYALSLTVYCTSWTYYGSIGEASRTGLLFLAIYLGPSITLCVWRPIIDRLVGLRNQFGATSYIDLLVARHADSRFIGAFGSLFLLVGLIPYIALQIKSISQTTSLLTGKTSFLLDLSITALLLVFTIVYGLSRFDNRQYRSGLVMVIAAESLLKIMGVLVIGLWVCFVADMRLNEIPGELISTAPLSYSFIGVRNGSDGITWVSWLLLSSSAILFLPRQFHMAVVENKDALHVRRARWLFPLYLFCINLFVVPIAMYGLKSGLPAQSADTFLLGIPLAKGWKGLSIFVFLGGFCSALGMIVVETVSLSMIVMNGLIAPMIAAESMPVALKSHLLKVRWALAAMILSLALVFEHLVGKSFGLASLGLVSFAAVLQFAPVTLGALFWSRSSKIGVIGGLCSGAAVWFYLLFMPALVRAGYLLDPIFLSIGPGGVHWLAPESLFGLSGLDPIASAVFWSLLFNVCSYVFLSLSSDQTPEDVLLATRFMEGEKKPFNMSLDPQPTPTVPMAVKIEKLVPELRCYFGQKVGEDLIRESLMLAGITEEENVSLVKLLQFKEQIHARIASSLGGSAAKMVLERACLFSTLDSKHLDQYYLDTIRNFGVDPMELNRRLAQQVNRLEIERRHGEELRETVKLVRDELDKERMRSIQSAKMAALGQMAAGVAHEINNPLAIVSASLENIYFSSDSIPEPSKNFVLDSIQISRNAIDRIKRIVKALQSFSRNSHADPFSEVSVKKVIEDSWSLCQKKIESNRVKLYLPDCSENLKVLGHAGEIEQVMVNLIFNSVDAVADCQERWIKMEVVRLGEKLQLSVIDSGPGIPVGIVDKIMDPFFTTKEVGKGTGIGLALSKKIAENHGGRLYLDRTSVNTRFVLELPVPPVVGGEY